MSVGFLFDSDRLIAAVMAVGRFDGWRLGGGDLCAAMVRQVAGWVVKREAPGDRSIPGALILVHRGLPGNAARILRKKYSSSR
ncbi:hypothetical protein, partial [Burkholderia thailandensis]|uniref:hypothetical protein n=1 Tax=Burkholderia thailandensis TaxID=57975 RepID=UPI001CA52D83